MHYTGITCITSNYTHSTATSKQIFGTVYAVPRRVLAAKGGITDPDQPCHSTFGPPPSSRGSQLFGPILRFLEPASRVHTTESAGPWIPWAPLRLILQPVSSLQTPGTDHDAQQTPAWTAGGVTPAYTFGERDVVEYYLLVPIFRPCEVSRPMSMGKDGLHHVLLHRGQGHARKMLRIEPDVRCYLQHSISLVI